MMNSEYRISGQIVDIHERYSRRTLFAVALEM